MCIPHHLLSIRQNQLIDSEMDISPRVLQQCPRHRIHFPCFDNEINVEAWDSSGGRTAWRMERNIAKVIE